MQNESQTSVWKGFKVIGIINIIFELLYLIAILIVGYSVIHLVNTDEEIQRKYGDQKTGIYIFLIIYFVLNILSNLFELYLNFGLSNQKVSNYGSKVKRWLVFNTVFFVIGTIFLIAAVIIKVGGLSSIILSLVYQIVMLVEIIIIRHFYKQMPLDSGRNTGNQPTNV